MVPDSEPSTTSEDDRESAVDDDQGAGSFFGGEDDTNSGGRPSAADITAAFEEETGGDMPTEISECIGEGLHDSDLPNGVLRALIEGREAEVDEGNLDDYESTMETIAADCATG